MYFINILTLLIPILIAMAFLTLVERKILGYMQLRKGPNIVGPYGILQPFADAMKLFMKEPMRPLTTSMSLFIIAPTLSLTLALSLWIPLPMPHPLINLNLGMLFILATSSLSVYSILWSGWASNSKYSLFGALRAVAQTISYEVTMAIILLSVLLMSGSFSLQMLITTQEHIWLLIPAWPMAMMWYISTLAETNRAPFDLTEGESELVSGFNVEYAAGPFALFFMAEYTNIILMNALTSIVFLGPLYHINYPELYSTSFMTETLLLSTTFLWIRASYPRFRYDQLMHLLWKNFLPLTLAFCMWYISLPIFLAGIPPYT
ncbi:NADH dehydrogenase subunit 1 (mitochondrion) [Rattus norvegicus]|uniref:NADH-ubiquinone oxidoreductase chain 1 n=2 Tax=Rattus norvegicus TaxID=10116 RepID=NU1M_RAT|nr:NADH dehydrogenase subunit 1 [Rattus norvegicus]P03889.3 RecName: Full=NADH-ubiquinone oxidoreductase chain 1; AltName: Full=NADH dehydrogenase subunit 1 [Rattus norvegicus]AAN77594.1 NADH dehydrogenase subunit 1 [Rattus norvegicus]AAV31039.1 NADH dehydrogenase subunit 1 [Rattus norvegicus]ABG11766.1 NADH dehydrogenase subunit 1 [Rattus norvegicus]ABG11773.1 NADH dehydrogenase subunit 1 [Rattus norvegicus]ABG11792.1 NADH dehydrogenase subunit 1 [Rattus norvegicus]|eukprot:YP_665629.1 NADH dehydrogenase subunit 1 (mitochondrion) [Rattus norvegicus]